MSSNGRLGQHFPLVSAPSGHLLLALENFDKATADKGGVPEHPKVFHAATDQPDQRGPDDQQ